MSTFRLPTMCWIVSGDLRPRPGSHCGNGWRVAPAASRTSAPSAPRCHVAAFMGRPVPAGGNRRAIEGKPPYPLLTAAGPPGPSPDSPEGCSGRTTARGWQDWNADRPCPGRKREKVPKTTPGVISDDPQQRGGLNVAAFYANQNFPLGVVQALRACGAHAEPARLHLTSSAEPRPRRHCRLYTGRRCDPPGCTD